VPSNPGLKGSQLHTDVSIDESMYVGRVKHERTRSRLFLYKQSKIEM
jgi:hypothetical protein